MKHKGNNGPYTYLNDTKNAIKEYYKLKQRLCLTKEELENAKMNPNFIRRKWRINEVQR